MIRLAGALWLGRQRLEPKLQAHAARLGRGRRRRRDRAATVAYLRDERRRIISAITRTDRELGEAVRDGATPEQIARSVTRCTEQLLDLAAAIRHQTVPADLEPARRLAASLVDRPLTQLTAFVDATMATLDPAAPPGPDLGGGLALDPAVDAALGAALGAPG